MMTFSINFPSRFQSIWERILLHGGRTDADTGHHDYKNKSKLGSYHFHHRMGPHLHPHYRQFLLDLLTLQGATILTVTNVDSSGTWYSFEAMIPVDEGKYVCLELSNHMTDGFYFAGNGQFIFLEPFWSTELSPVFVSRTGSKWIGYEGAFDFLVNSDYFLEMIKKLIALTRNRNTIGKFYLYDETELDETLVTSGYCKYVYETVEGYKKVVDIYKTNPNSQKVSIALSSMKESIESKNLVPIDSNPEDTVVKMSAAPFDTSESGKSFYGIMLSSDIENYKILSKDGFIDIQKENPIFYDGIDNSNWFRYFPCFCIDQNGNAIIRWFAQKSTPNVLSLEDAKEQYQVIIGGQHCLVYDSKSVFEEAFLGDKILSSEHIQIADWQNINNVQFHNNDGIGGFSCKESLKRSLLGHCKDGSFVLACVTENYLEKSGGMNLQQAARMMLDLNCDYAVNMVGHSPTQMLVSGTIVVPSPDKLGSCVCVVNTEKIVLSTFGKLFKTNVFPLETTDVSYRYNEYYYVFKDRLTNLGTPLNVTEIEKLYEKNIVQKIYVYKTVIGKQDVAPGLSSKNEKLYTYTKSGNTDTWAVHPEMLNPPPYLCPQRNVVAKSNAAPLDKDGTASFHGIFLTTASDGKKTISLGGIVDATEEQISEYESNILFEPFDIYKGWYQSYPSFCIDHNNNAEIHWFSKKSGSGRITIREAKEKYKTIISGQHCLVFKGKSVFEEEVIYSDEGIRIADWDHLSNKNYHHNEEIGDENSKTLCRRTLFGHLPDGSFLLVCIEGHVDWFTPKSGVYLKEAARIMLDFGCDFAMNMDGGSPTQMIVDNKVKVTGKENRVDPGNYPIGSTICAYEK